MNIFNKSPGVHVHAAECAHHRGRWRIHRLNVRMLNHLKLEQRAWGQGYVDDDPTMASSMIESLEKEFFHRGELHHHQNRHEQLQGRHAALNSARRPDGWPVTRCGGHCNVQTSPSGLNSSVALPPIWRAPPSISFEPICPPGRFGDRRAADPPARSGGFVPRRLSLRLPIDEHLSAVVGQRAILGRVGPASSCSAIATVSALRGASRSSGPAARMRVLSLPA